MLSSLACLAAEIGKTSRLCFLKGPVPERDGQNAILIGLKDLLSNL